MKILLFDYKIVYYFFYKKINIATKILRHKWKNTVHFSTLLPSGRFVFLRLCGKEHF
jgi:hypothetical protein